MISTSVRGKNLNMCTTLSEVPFLFLLFIFLSGSCQRMCVVARSSFQCSSVECTHIEPYRLHEVCPVPPSHLIRLFQFRNSIPNFHRKHQHNQHRSRSLPSQASVKQCAWLIWCIHTSHRIATQAGRLWHKTSHSALMPTKKFSCADGTSFHSPIPVAKSATQHSFSL
jgi:hypothetical protein